MACMQDVGRFFMFTGVIQLIFYLLMIPNLSKGPGAVRFSLMQLMVSVLNALEPLIPAIVVFVKTMCLLRLKWHGILVADSRKMLVAGHLDVVVFDKTGTLTGEQVTFAWSVCFGYFLLPVRILGQSALAYRMNI